MTLTIELPPEIERHLAHEAARHGLTAAQFVRSVLEDRLATSSDSHTSTAEEQRDSVQDYRELPRRSPEDLKELARLQGASLAVDWAALRPDFWPADEPVDDFLNAVREWRKDASLPDNSS